MTLAIQRTRRPMRARPIRRSRTPEHRRAVWVQKDADETRAVEAFYHAVMEAIGRLQGSTDGQRILTALLGHDIDGLLNALDWAGWTASFDRASALLATRWEDATRAALIELGPGAYAAVGFTPAQATLMGAGYSATRITGITDETRLAVRSLIGRSVREGWSIPRTTELLRDTVGLTERWTIAVANYRIGLEEHGVDDGRIRLLVSDYRDRLETGRAEMIARTEVLSASNDGRQQSWELAAAAGAIPANSVKEFVAADGSCAECDGLNGEQVALADDFSFGDAMPPVHPNCRCTAVIAGAGTSEE